MKLTTVFRKVATEKKSMTEIERLASEFATSYSIVACNHDEKVSPERLRKEAMIFIRKALERDRVARPHVYEGTGERNCEWCGKPQSDQRHLVSRVQETLNIKRSVEAEREACAKIGDEISQQEQRPVEEYYQSRGVLPQNTTRGYTAEEIARKIRARGEKD